MKLSLLCILFLFCESAKSQSEKVDSLNVLLDKLEKFNKEFPQEKVHIHLNQPVYTAGDTIFFKAYVVRGDNNQFSTISKVLHVDFISNKNEIIYSQQHFISNGNAQGTLVVPDSIQSDFVRIRAYTNWMRNFEGIGLYEKFVPVLSLSRDTIISQITLLNADSIPGRHAAEVSYYAINQEELAGNTVDYTLLHNNQQLSNGSATTNVNGKAVFYFTGQYDSAVLLTRLRLKNNRTLVRSFPVFFASPIPSIEFFPESGNLVTGVKSRVAFKVSVGSGARVEAKGYIEDQLGKNIVQFTSDDKGYGSFHFLPVKGNVYYAVIEGFRPLKKTKLPAAQQSGYVLSIENHHSERVGLRISVSKDLVGKEVTIIAQSNNIIRYAGKIRLHSEVVDAVIPKQKFPTGIVEFLMLSDDYITIAQRLAFVQQNDHLRISLQSNKQIYKPREKVRIELTVKDDLGLPAAGVFSIAINNDFERQDTLELSILTNLHFTSDLSNVIEMPLHDLTNMNFDKARQLDNLLITQQWKRLDWNRLKNGVASNLYFMPEQGITVSGTVRGKNDEAVAGAEILLISKTGKGFIRDTITSKDGRFQFSNLEFDTASNYVVQINGKHQNSLIKLDTILPPYISKKSPDSYTANNRRKFLDNSFKWALKYNSASASDRVNRTTLLKTVVVEAKKRTPLEEALQPSRNLNGPGNADQVLTYLDLNYCTNFAICLQGKVWGIIFERSEAGTFVFSTRTMSTPSTFDSLGREIRANGPGRKPMLIVIDGISRPGTSLEEISGSDVQAVEVLRSVGRLAVYGFQGESGVLVITTKRGGIDYNQNLLTIERAQRGLVFGKSAGYAPVHQFSLPDYGSNTSQSKSIDNRSAIYWNPELYTDENGKAFIEFFNSDLKGKYQVVVEGISHEGQAGRTIYTYHVN